MARSPPLRLPPSASASASASASWLPSCPWFHHPRHLFLSSFQDAGGTRFGTIGKRFFKSALGIGFQHYTFTPQIYDELADFYGCGAPDRFEGGKTLVAWRDFCNDFLASVKFDHHGGEVSHAGNDGIAGRGDTAYVHTIPGAQK